MRDGCDQGSLHSIVLEAKFHHYSLLDLDGILNQAPMYLLVTDDECAAEQDGGLINAVMLVTVFQS